MWDTFVLNQSSKFELYILGPLCCSVALTIMVKNNLSGALTVFGDYKLSVYNSTIVEFHPSSKNPCSSFQPHSEIQRVIGIL